MEIIPSWLLDSFDPERTQLIIATISRLEILGKRLEELKHNESQSSIWRYKSVLEALPFTIARRRGYLKASPTPDVKVLNEQADALYTQLGRLARGCKIEGHLQEKIISRSSFIEKNWLNLALYVTAALFARKTIYRIDPQVIWQASFNLMSAGSNLLRNWVMLPLMEIWDTVRYSRSKIRITNQLTLQQDVEALHRMVHQYHADRNLITNDINDFSAVLRDYEKYIKSPVKSAIYGDLIRLILIQVQKGKVDLGEAMLSLDKLLRSNELNFELLAVIPVLGVLYLSWQRVRSVWNDFRGRSTRALSKAFRDHVHALELVLGDVNENKDMMYGMIFYHCFCLVGLFEKLGTPDKRDLFQADLLQVMNPETNSDTKRWAALRIRHYYSF